MALSLGFGERTGDSSNKQIGIIPRSKYKPELSSLFITIPLHLHKVASNVRGKSLDFSRQQLLSGYSDTDWPTLFSYCLSVFEKKKAKLAIQVSEVDFLKEIQSCRRYYMEAQQDSE